MVLEFLVLTTMTIQKTGEAGVICDYEFNLVRNEKQNDS